MGLSRIEALKWVRVFGKEFGDTAAPYYGVNLFDVRPEDMEAVAANVAVQTGLAQIIGGQHEAWSERDDGGRVRVVWIMSYPHGVNSRGAGPLAIWRLRRFFPTWFEFCGLIGSYEWFIATELASSTDEYLERDLR